MKEFVLLIRDGGNNLDNMSPDELQKHIKKFGSYIANLMEQGKLKSAHLLRSAAGLFRVKMVLLKTGHLMKARK